jgi:lysyl-tRNA synthetase, class II
VTTAKSAPSAKSEGMPQGRPGVPRTEGGGKPGTGRTDGSTASGAAGRPEAGKPDAGKPEGVRTDLRREPAPPARRAQRNWVPRVVGYITYLSGFFDILSAISPGFRRGKFHGLGGYVPAAEQNVATAATLMSGIMLIFVAHALKRRKRRAWWVAVVLQVSIIVFHVVRSFRVAGEHEGPIHHLGGPLILSLILLILLIVYRSEFHALGDPRSRLRGFAAFGILTATSVGIGMAIMYTQSRHFDDVPGTHIRQDPSFFARLQHVVEGLVGVSGPVAFRDPYGDLVAAMLLGLGLLTAIVTAYLILRPAEPVARLSTDDELRMRELIEKQGRRDSLAYFATRRDKSVIWSPSGKAAVAYRVVSGVMLASGDPIGDPEAWPGAIKLFVEEADRHAWTPAVVGCSETGGEVWCREADLDALELGDEAICTVAEFSLEGRAMRNVRQMVNRVERQGYVCQVRRARDIGREELDLVRSQAEAWRGKETERGFSMALGADRFGDPQDTDCVVATAVKDGEARAVINFVPWGTDGMSLDLMVRDRDADPGLNELLIVKAIEACKGLGIQRISLNFAVFRSALERGEKLGAGPITRMWRGTLIFFSRWYQIESLYKFNSKFRPVWEPRFVAFKNTRDIPRVALAYAEAEGFIVPPGLPWRKKQEPDTGAECAAALAELKAEREAERVAGGAGSAEGSGDEASGTKDQND